MTQLTDEDIQRMLDGENSQGLPNDDGSDYRLAEYKSLYGILNSIQTEPAPSRLKYNVIKKLKIERSRRLWGNRLLITMCFCVGLSFFYFAMKQINIVPLNAIIPYFWNFKWLFIFGIGALILINYFDFILIKKQMGVTV